MTLPIPAVGDFATAAWADQVAGAYQPWTTYIPVLTASSTNPTLGPGYVAAGRYCQIGKTVIGVGRISFGGSGTSAGSGTYYISMPLPQVSTAGGSAQLQGHVRMISAGAYTDGYLQLNSTSLVQPTYTTAQVGGAAQGADATHPGAWTANDRLDFQFAYETT
jgi:hypothetical protein